MIVVLDREFRMYDSNSEEINYAISNLMEAVEIKPQTNADRIRNMTDEELAEFLVYTQSTIKNCMIGVEDCKHENTDKDCKDCFLEWLQAEVKEGGTDDRV
jgi:hypothetical protein